MKELLQDLGINIGMSVAGLFGSVLMVGKDAAMDLRKSVTSIFAGVASANYLTPVASDMFDVTKVNYQFSIAFLLGFLGLKGVELLLTKVIKDKVVPKSTITPNKIPTKKSVKKPRR
jgi:hypothetical protein